MHISPTQLAWTPFVIPTLEEVDFISSLEILTGLGDPTLRKGLATHVYAYNVSIEKHTFINLDGNFCIIPQQGALNI